MRRLDSWGSLTSRTHRELRSGALAKLLPRCFSVDAEMATSSASSPAEASSSGVMELWAWGKGEVGQLGLGDEETQRSPSLVKSFSLPSCPSVAPAEGLLARSAPSFPAAQPSDAPHPQQGFRQIETGGKEELGFSKIGGSRPFVRSMHESSRTGEGAGAGGGEGVGITCGLFHSGLWMDGQLWLWGKGSGGRLGLGSEEPQYSPTPVSSLGDVTSVALGGLHSVAIAGGSLYTWGFGGFGALGHGDYSKQVFPKRVVGEEWMENVKAVSAGGSHSAAVSGSGELYTWGRDEGEGRLGHGDGGGADEGAEPFPIRVEALPMPVAAVACGGFCTMALTPQGQLWSWGGNKNFELGRGSRRDDWRPKPVPDLESTRIVQVACGGYHAAALTDEGRLLTWGHGGHGQLGHGSLLSGRVPCVVEALASERVVAISCGSSWTGAVTEGGELYTWGKNRDNQLGVPHVPDTQMSPILVGFENGEGNGGDGNSQSTSSRVLCVSAGSTHGLALVYRATGTASSVLSSES